MSAIKVVINNKAKRNPEPKIISPVMQDLSSIISSAKISCQVSIRNQPLKNLKRQERVQNVKDLTQSLSKSILVNSHILQVSKGAETTKIVLNQNSSCRTSKISLRTGVVSTLMGDVEKKSNQSQIIYPKQKDWRTQEMKQILELIKTPEEQQLQNTQHKKKLNDQTEAVTQVALKAFGKKMSNQEIKTEILTYLKTSYPETERKIDERKNEEKRIDEQGKSWSQVKPSQFFAPIEQSNESSTESITLLNQSKIHFEKRKKKIIENVKKLQPIMKRFQRFDPEIQVPPLIQQTNKEINSSTFEEDLLAFAFDPNSEKKQVDTRKNNRELFKKSIMAQEDDQSNKAKLLIKKQDKNSIQSLLFDARKSSGNENSKKPNEVTFKNAYLQDGDQRPIPNPLANSNLLQSHWDIQDNNCLSLTNFKLEDPKLKMTHGSRFKSIDRVVGALASHPSLPIMNRTLHRRQQIELMKKTLQSDLSLFQNIHSVTNEDEDLLPLLDSNRHKLIEISEQDIFNQTQFSNRISSLVRDSFELENGLNRHMQIKDQLLITSNFRAPSMKSDKVKIINAPTFKQQLQHRKSMQKTLGEKSVKADKSDVSHEELNNLTMVSFSPGKQFNWDPLVERKNILDKIYSHQNSFKEMTLIPSSEGIRTRNDKQIVVHVQSQTQREIHQISEQFQDISSASTPQPITQTQLPLIQHQKKKKKERIFKRIFQKQNAEEVLGFGTFFEIANSRPIKNHRRQTIDQH